MSFLPRCFAAAQREISLVVMAYNLERMLGVPGGSQIRDAFAIRACIVRDYPRHKGRYSQCESYLLPRLLAGFVTTSA